MVVPPLIPKIISSYETKKLLYLMENCLCEIYIPNGLNGTGFFCKISNKANSKPYFVMMTNHHVLHEGFLKYEERIDIKVGGQYKRININDNRKIYTNKENDITIIEIIPSKDEINNFMELHDELFREDEELFRKEEELERYFICKSIYILHSMRDNGVSFGNIKKISEGEIIHTCSVEKGSSGAPILDYNGKVIGIHFGENL